jgi:outer membrane protein TolC
MNMRLKHNTFFMLLLALGCNAAAQPLTETRAVQLALERHPQMALSQAQIEQLRALRPAAYNLPMLELQTEAPAGDFYTVGFMQTIPFPGQWVQQRKVLGVQEKIAQADLAINRNTLVLQTRSTYQLLQYWLQRVALLGRQDSILADFVRATDVRYRVGQTKYIEKINGEARYRAVQQQLAQSQAGLQGAQKQLALLTGEGSAQPANALARLTPPKLEEAVDTAAYAQLQANPLLGFYTRQTELSKQALRLERTRTLPGLAFGYMNQGPPDNPVRNNWRLGLFIPVWFWSHKSALNSAKLGVNIAQHRKQVEERRLGTQYVQASAALKQATQALSYYDGIALQQSEELINVARKTYQLGETNYVLYLQSLEQAFAIQSGYLDAVLNYNQAVLQLLYLRGEI